MQEIIKDSAIKLFGKKIPFDLEVAWTMSDDDDEDVIKETEDDVDETEQHQQGPSPEDVHDESDNPKTPSIEEETSKPKDSDKNPTTLKKPDKILACPRCKSMDTKFCYYNNYNVNQPRHFCKSCQRYWTSGGTMRNVPVGAGRRKSKSSSAAAAAAYPQQICISAESLHHQYIPNSRTNTHHHGTVLSFSSDSRTQGTAGGRAAMNSRIVDDSSSESTVTTTTSNNRNEELLSHPNSVVNGYGVVHPHPPPPWPYNMAAVPFYPFWTCHVPATPWNLPWPPPPLPPPPPPPPATYPCSEKRYREGGDDSEERGAKKVLAPKTLRMDDPNDAAKSSIWATLGIKKDGGAAPKGGFFKGFEKTTHMPGDHQQAAAGGENASVLHCVNPAAFSRSLNFHERH